MFFPFFDADLEGAAAHFLDGDGADPFLIDAGSLGERFQVIRGDLGEGFDKVFFDDVGRGVDHFVGKVAVVGDEEEAGGLFVEPADGEEPFRIWEKIEDNGFFARADAGADIAYGFVEDVVNFFCSALTFSPST